MKKEFPKSVYSSLSEISTQTEDHKNQNSSQKESSLNILTNPILFQKSKKKIKKKSEKQKFPSFLIESVKNLEKSSKLKQLNIFSKLSKSFWQWPKKQPKNVFEKFSPKNFQLFWIQSILHGGIESRNKFNGELKTLSPSYLKKQIEYSEYRQEKTLNVYQNFFLCFRKKQRFFQLNSLTLLDKSFKFKNLSVPLVPKKSKSTSQTASILANIKKTCLVNIQLKHYYYKSSCLDRFLFDLLKLFKPSILGFYPITPKLQKFMQKKLSLSSLSSEEFKNSKIYEIFENYLVFQMFHHFFFFFPKGEKKLKKKIDGTGEDFEKVLNRSIRAIEQTEEVFSPVEQITVRDQKKYKRVQGQSLKQNRKKKRIDLIESSHKITLKDLLNSNRHNNNLSLIESFLTKNQKSTHLFLKSLCGRPVLWNSNQLKNFNQPFLQWQTWFIQKNLLATKIPRQEFLKNQEPKLQKNKIKQQRKLKNKPKPINNFISSTLLKFTILTIKNKNRIIKPNSTKIETLISLSQDFKAAFFSLPVFQFKNSGFSLFSYQADYFSQIFFNPRFSSTLPLMIFDNRSIILTREDKSQVSQPIKQVKVSSFTNLSKSSPFRLRIGDDRS